MVKIKKYLEGLIPVIVSLAILVLFLIQPLAQAQQGASPMTTSTSIGQVTPMLNTNVTWSTFYNGWSPLEYNNGTANLSLNTGTSAIYSNPVSVNPIDLVSSYLTSANTTGTPFNSSQLVSDAGAGGGSVQTVSYANGIYTLTQNTSASSTEFAGWDIGGTISDAKLPSNSIAFDYVTIAYELIGPKMTGVSAGLTIWNSSGASSSLPNSSITPGQSIWASAPLSEFTGANLNVSVSSSIKPTLQLGLPESASTTYKIELSAFLITEKPLYLGSNTTGQRNTAINPTFSTFSPNFQWTEITNGGYTVATSQPMGIASNYTETQASISSGSYIEETTQQAIFSLPTAPDLSYTNSNLTLQMNGINASQVTLINANGASYSSGLSGFNGSTYALTTVNPNSPNSVIIQVEYTAAQWNSFTSAPSFFSVAGIEYYWWIFIISTLGAVGLFAGLKSYAAGKEETQRVVPPPRMR